MTARLTWPEYAMRLAEAAASRSEDLHLKVGACVLRADNTVAALGYNGAPPGVTVDWEDRDARRAWVIHAEANALRYVTPGEGVTLVTTAIPCPTCMLTIASYGIKRVYFRDDLDWATYDYEHIMAIAEKSGIAVERIA